MWEKIKSFFKYVLSVDRKCMVCKKERAHSIIGIGGSEGILICLNCQRTYEYFILNKISQSGTSHTKQ